MRDRSASEWEGWAFTFCKAGFLVLLFSNKYALICLSGLATFCYLIAVVKGNTVWKCWLRPPWITLFWGCVFCFEIARHLGVLHSVVPGIPFLKS